MENQNTTNRETISQDAVAQATTISPENQEKELFSKVKANKQMFIDDLEKGTHACLPNKDGFADTTPATNPVNNSMYKGADFLLLKSFSAKNNCPTSEFVTLANIKHVNNKLKLPFKEQVSNKGVKGFSLVFKQAITDAETGKTNYESSYYTLFNVNQLKNAEQIKNYKIIADQERKNYIAEKLEAEGKKFVPYSKDNQKEQKTLVCSSTVPHEYLGQYFAAVSSGSKFQVTVEQAKTFVSETVSLLNTIDQDRGQSNPFALNILAKKANDYCKEFLPTLNPKTAVEKDAPKAEKPKQQKKEKDASIEMGM